MKGLIICFLLIVSLFSCQRHSQDAGTSSNEQTENTRLDTVQVIADMNIREKIFMSGLLETDSKSGLQSRIDTIELMYIPFACDCPHWVVAAEYNRVDRHNSVKKNNQSDNFVEFNNAEYSYYIEPACKELKLPDYVCVNRNIIRFTGRSYNQTRYPADADFMDPNPPKAKVLRYYGYEILKPYKVWGPKVQNVGTVDYLGGSTILTVK